MECVLCHKKELSKTRCINGHYVCNDCHTNGMDTIIELCINETSKNPIEIIEKMPDGRQKQMEMLKIIRCMV